MLQRQKRKILLCKRDLTQPNIEVFESPIAVRIDVQTMSDQRTISTIGHFDKDYMIAKVSNHIAKLFTKGDRCYIMKNKPTASDEQCLDADFVVKSIKPVGSVTEIIFEGMI